MAKRTLRNALLGIVPALVLVGGTPAQAHDTKAEHEAAQQTGKLSKTDRAFIKQAAQAHLAEISLGTLAAERAQSEGVKQFAQDMVESHSNALDRLATVAEDNGVALPVKVTKADQQTHDRLARLKGARFDREYLKVMETAHARAARLFRDEVENGKNPDVTAYAQQLLPTIQMHLRMAAAASRRRTM